MAKKSDKGIYSGLSNEEALAIMNATIEVRKELPTLERNWQPAKFWRFAVITVACLAGIVAVLGNVFSLSLGLTCVAAGLVLLVGVFVAWAIFAHTEKRLAYLRALDLGLQQFKEAAEKCPGASSHDLLAVMP